MKFLDQAKIHIESGNGGNGCVSFRREKYVEFGGPNGGNGGKGGNVIIKCVDGLNTLIDYRYRQHFKAKNGSPGMGSDKTGRSGEDTIIEVPRGTLILEEDNEERIGLIGPTKGQSIFLHGMLLDLFPPTLRSYENM